MSIRPNFKTSAEASIQVGEAVILNFVAAIPDTTILEDNYIELSVDDFTEYLDTNVKLDELTWKLADNTNLYCSSRNDSLFINPLSNWYGVDSLKLIALYEDISDTTDYVVNVTSVNDIPIVSNLPDITFPEDSLYTLNLNNYAIDVDDSLHTLNWEVDIIYDNAKITDLNNISDVLVKTIKKVNKIPIRTKSKRVLNRSMNVELTGNQNVSKTLFVINEQHNFDRSTRSKDFVDPDSITITINSDTHIATIKGANHFNIEKVPFVFSATDTSMTTGSDTLTVTINPVDDVPTVEMEFQDLLVQEDFDNREYLLTDYFRDVDLDQLEFTVNLSPEGVVNYSIKDSTLTISCIPNVSGTTQITVYANDGQSKTQKTIVSDTFEISVEAVNDIPVITQEIDDILLYDNFNNFSLNLNTYFSDVETEELIYLLSYDPTQISCSITDSILSITNEIIWDGTATLSITAIDGESGEVTESFSITIDSGTSAPLAPLFGTKTIYLAFADYSDTADDLKMEFESGDDVHFKVKDGDSEVSITDYLATHSTLPYSVYLVSALEDYFKTMSNEKLDLKVELLESNEPNGVWKLNTKSYYENVVQKYQLRTTIMSDLKDSISVVANAFYDSILNADNMSDETVFVNFILPDFDEESGHIKGNNTETQLEESVTFDKILRKLTQQLGQTVFALGTKGHELSDAHFDGYISDVFMGRAGSQTGPYDLMFHSEKGNIVSPYSLYGLNAIHTNDLIHQGYLDTDIVEANESSVLTLGENKYSIRLNSLRTPLLVKETKGKKSILPTKAVKIPVLTDANETNDISYPHGSNVEDQYFLIEYRDPSGYDELSPFGQEDACEGILISHVINGNGYDPVTELSSAVIDIESATPLIDYRDPNLTNINDQSYNGTYYNGRQVIDWLDDFNDNNYELQGGASSYDLTSDGCSLQTDFFNDTRNKFTPLTEPSTDSWKLNDTHIGVFIDSMNIDENYADITVYRNYWSEPILTDTSIRVNGIGYLGENFTVQSNAEFIIGSAKEEPELSIFTVISGAQMTVRANSTLKLTDNSMLVIEDGANIIFEEGSNLVIEGNATISGNIGQLFASLTITDEAKLTLDNGSSIELIYLPTPSIFLGINSELIVESEAIMTFRPSTYTECSPSSMITIRDGGTLIAGEQSSFVGTDTWEGIVAEIGSSVSMYFTSISNATWGINAQASDINLTRTSFSNCDNGIWLLNCDNYDLYDCYFNGKGSGTGIRVTESTGVLKSNTVLNHSSGIVLVSCSPLITESYLHDNATCGIALYGYNTYPQLINPSSTNDDLNNKIINNGLITTGENGSQIFMMYRANVYLNNGYNNIYSGVENSIPVVPCIKTISDMTVNQQKVEISQMVKIPAEYNYWGTEEILDVNRSEYFELWVDIPKGYSIDYDPYATSAFDPGLPQPPHYSTNEPTTQEEILLKVAMLLEDKGNFKPSIKKYEDIIEKYPDSDEYYVATSRLPQVLAKEEESLEPLLKTYDDAIASEDINNKKFIKQMKVSTNIKSKKYDEAITMAEVLKTEAETDVEKDLCDIEIAICNMMKTAEGTDKSNKVDYLALINQLITNLMDDDIGKKLGKNLPTEFKLHNNYPNPFNPITTIKYDLPFESNVKINIYNIRGAKVDQLVTGTIPAGYHKAQFNASRFSNGLYYYTLEINNKVKDVKKMLLIK